MTTSCGLPTSDWFAVRSTLSRNPQLVPQFVVSQQFVMQLVRSRGQKKRTAQIHMSGPLEGAGDGLLSRVLSNGVPSALQGLTTVFGMGTGVAPALQSPAKISCQKKQI